MAEAEVTDEQAPAEEAKAEAAEEAKEETPLVRAPLRGEVSRRGLPVLPRRSAGRSSPERAAAAARRDGALHVPQRAVRAAAGVQGRLPRGLRRRPGRRALQEGHVRLSGSCASQTGFYVPSPRSARTSGARRTGSPRRRSSSARATDRASSRVGHQHRGSRASSARALQDHSWRRTGRSSSTRTRSTSRRRGSGSWTAPTSSTRDDRPRARLVPADPPPHPARTPPSRCRSSSRPSGTRRSGGPSSGTGIRTHRGTAPSPSSRTPSSICTR